MKELRVIIIGENLRIDKLIQNEKHIEQLRKTLKIITGFKGAGIRRESEGE